MDKHDADDLFAMVASMVKKLGLDGSTADWARVKFHGEIFYFGGYDFKEGSITRAGQYERFEQSYAHLTGGKVWQNGVIIGDESELEFLPPDGIKHEVK